MLLFFYVPSKAENLQLPRLEAPLNWQEIPVICGPQQSIIDKMESQGLRPVEISFGRRGAQPDADVVFAIIQYVGDNNERAVVMSLPNDPTACAIYISFNAQSITPQ